MIDIKRIQKLKLELIELINSTKSPSSLSQRAKCKNENWFFDFEYDLPTGWLDVNFMDVTWLITCGVAKKPDYVEEGIPFLSAQNARPFIANLDKIKFISKEQFDKLTIGGKPEKDDILYTRVGNCGEAAKVPFDFDFAIYVSLTLIKPIHSLIDADFLVAFLNSNLGLTQAKAGAIGSGLQNLNVNNVRKYRIPLPSLAEQKRIVAKINDTFKLLDKIRKKWENIILLHEQYIKACVSGSLEGSYYKKDKLFLYLEESTLRIGKNWQGVKKVGVSAQKGITELETGQKVTFENYKVVRPGDFVYNAMRVNIGSIAIYEGRENAITSPDYIVFRVKKYLSPKLLLGYLKSEMGLLEINANTKGSVRSRLYFKDLVNINYPIAPLDTQEQAEKVLTWFSSAINKWNELIEPSLAKLQSALLVKAFRGELVQQSPDDEPAEDLLKRILEIKSGIDKGKAGKKSLQKKLLLSGYK